MYPLLVMLTFVFVIMNLYLLYTWICSGQYDTIINKFICIKQFCWTLYSLGCVLDFYLRLDGYYPVSLSQANYCACWIVFYKVLLFTVQIIYLVMALIRFLCVKYAIEFHIRSVTNIVFNFLTNKNRFPNEESKNILFYKIVSLVGLSSCLLAALDQVSI